jgi:hypothetical protein
MLYAAKGSTESVQQDKILEIAIRVADPSISFNPKYYQNRDWEPHVSNSRHLRNIGSSILKEHVCSLQDLVKQQDMSELRVPKPSNVHLDDCPESWHRYFNLRPRSSQMSRVLLPEALEAIQNEEGEEWVHPSDFHPAVLAGFRGQKDVLFYQHRLRGIEDLFANLLSYDTSALRWLKETTNYKKCPLKRVLKELILAQNRYLFPSSRQNMMINFSTVLGPNYLRFPVLADPFVSRISSLGFLVRDQAPTWLENETVLCRNVTQSPYGTELNNSCCQF